MVDAGTRLTIYVLERMDFNEELGTHRRRESKDIFVCNLCGEDCESVSTKSAQFFRVPCIIFRASKK